MIEIHTNFTNTVHIVHRLTLDDLADGQRRQWLKWAFADPDRLKPEQTTAAVTAQAAETFAQLAQRLRERGHDPHRVAHFVTGLLFCMFAEDIACCHGNYLPDCWRRRCRNPNTLAAWRKAWERANTRMI